MAALVWFLPFVVVGSMVMGEKGGSKGSSGTLITPFQPLGNLRPMNVKHNSFHEPIGPRQRPPEILPASPITIHQGGSYPVLQQGGKYGPITTGGHNSYAPSPNYGPGASYGSGPRGPRVIVIEGGHGKGHNVYQPRFELYGPIIPGYGKPKRKIIGYKTILEKRKVAVITNKKVAVPGTKQVVERVPRVRLVNQIVVLPKKY